MQNVYALTDPVCPSVKRKSKLNGLENCKRYDKYSQVKTVPLYPSMALSTTGLPTMSYVSWLDDVGPKQWSYAYTRCPLGVSSNIAASLKFQPIVCFSAISRLFILSNRNLLCRQSTAGEARSFPHRGHFDR